MDSVGPTGTVYGLDMTDEMLALAQQNAAEAGLPNVHFLKGIIEAIPLPANVKLLDSEGPVTGCVKP